MPVRAALGASRSRLLRQLLTESLLLALAAGALGTALAYAGLPAILALVPPGTIPDESEIALNTSVLIFALVVSVITSIVFGLAPAWHSSGGNLASSMREASRGLTANSRQALFRKTLVVLEVALAVMLLAGASLLVRTFVAMQRIDLEPARVTRAVVRQVYAIDSSQPVAEVQTLAAILNEEQYATPRFNLVLLSVFAVVGLTLAIVGVYGVMSNTVAQQAHEIGVRLALGARSGTITGMVLARGSWLLVTGLLLGLAASVAAARLLARQVWNVPAFDPVAFGVVSLIVLAAGLQACVWPARRASRIDPIVALRRE